MKNIINLQDTKSTCIEGATSLKYYKLHEIYSSVNN